MEWSFNYGILFSVILFSLQCIREFSIDLENISIEYSISCLVSWRFLQICGISISRVWKILLVGSGTNSSILLQLVQVLIFFLLVFSNLFFFLMIGIFLGFSCIVIVTCFEGCSSFYYYRKLYQCSRRRA